MRHHHRIRVDAVDVAVGAAVQLDAAVRVDVALLLVIPRRPGALVRLRY